MAAPRDANAHPKAPVKASPTVVVPPTSAKKVERSPNYPAVGPSVALEYAEKIWKLDKRNPMSSELACRHMGYTTKNGASQTMLGALKRYGLLVPAGGKEVRISDDAHFLFLAPGDHPERRKLLRKVALRPALFGEVLARYPAHELPSDTNLRFQLQKEWGFVSAAAADAFIAAFRDAVRLAGVAEDDRDSDTPRAEAEEEPMELAPPHPLRDTFENALGRPTQGPPTPTRGDALAQVPQTPPSTQSRTWDLGDGAAVTVVLPLRLSKKNVDKLKRYLAALEMEAAITWDEEEPGA